MSKDAAYDLYSVGTPNGHKITVALEEMGLAYNGHIVNIMKGEQHSPEFLAKCPNGKIPTLVDNTGEEPVTVWESGAILIYLAEKTGQFLPKEEPARSATIQWLMWQMGGLGPMLGQFGHFFKFAPERVEYGIARYAKEGKRLLGVLDAQLAKHPFVAGDEYTIADMAIYPWLAAVPRFYGEEAYDKLGFNEFEHVKAYMERIKERPPVQRGIEAMAFPKSS